MSLRLGGFVIHGNNAETLGSCLDSLLSVCDEVVAIDSCSMDGSADIVKKRGVRSIIHSWEGYGAARAAAAIALGHCEYLFYLDADEVIPPSSLEALANWRSQDPSLPHYKIRLRDWARLASGTFLFRTESRIRVVRRDCATWTPSMVVHEALPRRKWRHLGVYVDHTFARSVEALLAKQDAYALLWAIRACGEGRRKKSPLGLRTAHLLRNCILKGSFFRGWMSALRLGWAVGKYHARKYEYMREIHRGAYADELAAWQESRFQDLTSMVATRKPRPPAPRSIPV